MLFIFVIYPSGQKRDKNARGNAEREEKRWSRSRLEDGRAGCAGGVPYLCFVELTLYELLANDIYVEESFL